MDIRILCVIVSCPIYAMLANMCILTKKMFYRFLNDFLRIK
jgi:hypothetical protein